MIAVVVGLIASLLGGLGSDGPELKLNIDMSGADVSFELVGQTILSTNGGLNDQLRMIVAGSAVYIALAAIAMAVIYFVLGSVIEAGYARFNMDLVERKETKVETLFAYFQNWKILAATRFLKGLYIYCCGLFCLSFPELLQNTVMQ